MDLSRVQKEIREISQDKASGISVRVLGEDLTRLEGTLKGPKDTVYEGGKLNTNTRTREHENGKAKRSDPRSELFRTDARCAFSGVNDETRHIRRGH